MARLKSSPELREFIKRHEAFRAEPYDDVTGKRTIGYGDTESGVDVTSEEDAYSRMVDRIALAESELSGAINRDDLTQGQIDALADMHYNLGMNTLLENGIIDRINKGDFESVYESLPRYNKARDAKTGELREFPGLVRRANERARMWKSPPAGEVGADLGELISSYENEIMGDAQAPSLSDAILQFENESSLPPIDDVIAQYENEVDARPTRADRASQGLNIAKYAHDDSDADRRAEAMKLSRELQISPTEADDRLLNGSANDVKIDIQKREIVENFPATSTWAMDPSNYSLYRKDPMWAQGIETSAQSYRRWVLRGASSFNEISRGEKVDDFLRSLKGNVYTFEEGITQLKHLFGVISNEEAASEFRRLRSLKEATLPGEGIQDEMNLIAGSASILGDDLLQAYRGVRESLSGVSRSEREQMIGQVGQAMREAGYGAEAILSFSKVLWQNPEAAMIMASQSLNSTVGPWVLARVGGVVGGVAGLLGAPVTGGASAVVGATVGGGAVGFAQKMQEEMEAYRNPLTGWVDYEAFFNDQDALSEARTKAAIFGVSMATFDAVSEKFLGRYLVPALTASKKSTSAVGKAARLGTATTAELAVQSFTEGASETFGSSAVDLYMGELTTEKLFENIGQGFLEGALSVPTAGGIVVASAPLKIAEGNMKSAWTRYKESRSFNRLAKLADSTNAANQAYSDAQKLREAVEDSPLSEQYPDQTEALIESSIQENTQTAETQPVQELDTDIETITEAEIDAELYDDSRSSTNTVSVEAKVWRDFWVSKGIDPDAKIREFGPAVFAEYHRALQGNGTFTVSQSSWHLRTLTYGDIDALAYFGDNELNAADAVATQENIRNESPSLQQERGDGPIEGPETEQQGPPTRVETVYFEQESGPLSEDSVTREVSLRNKFRNQEEVDTFKRLRRNIRSVTKGTNISQEQADAAAEIQFRHMRMRSENTGIPLAMIEEQLEFRQNLSDENALGQYSANTGGIPYINLSSDAQITTILHELGHSWLTEMGGDWEFIHGIPDNLLTPSQREYKKAMDDTAKAFGLETLEPFFTYKGIEESVYVEVQERFAQTAEIYFLENKVENSLIRNVMESFRKWLTPFAEVLGKIYDQWPALEMNPEIEQIFNTLIQAEDKTEQFLVPMFSEPLFDTAILGEDAARYLDAIADSIDSAIAEFYSRITRQSYRERNKLIDESLNSAYDRAEAEINATPEAQFLTAMEDAFRIFKVDRESGVETSDPRINFDSLLALLGGDENLTQALRNRLNSNLVAPRKKGGVDVAHVMAQIGAITPAQLVTFLETASRRDQRIADRATEILNENYPVLKTDDEIHAIAVEAVQNLGKEKILRMEMKLLYDRYPVEFRRLVEKGMRPADIVSKMAKENIDRKGQDLVANSRASKFNPAKFLREANTHGRRASKRFAEQGDILGAFESKEQEAIHFAAYKVAQKMARKKARYMAMIKKVFRTADRKYENKRDLDLVNYARSLVRQIEQGQINLKRLDLSKGNLKHTVLSSQVETIQNMIDNFIAEMEGRTVEDMPLSAFLRFGELFATIYQIAGTAMSVEIEGRKMELNGLALEIVEEIGPRRSKDPTAGWARKMNEKGLYFITDVRNLFIGLFREGSEASTTLIGLFNMVAEAEAQFQIALNEAVAGVSKNLKNLVRKDRSFGDKDSPIAAPELSTTFPSMESVLLSLLYSGSESGLEAFLMGGFEHGKPIGSIGADGFLDTQAYWNFINRLIAEGKLTKDHFDTVQGIWDFFDQHHEAAKAAFRYTNGREMGTVEAIKVKTPWGEYTGGYYPLTANETLVSKGAELDVDPEVRKVRPLTPFSDLSFTRARKGASAPLDLTLGGLRRAMVNQLKVAYLRKPMADVGKALSHPDVINALEARRPESFEMIVKPWFEDVMMQQYTKPSDNPLIDSVARKFNRNAYITMFLGNTGTVIRQFLGLIQASGVVGGKNVASATVKVMFDIGVKNVLRSAATLQLSTPAMFNYVTNKSKRMEARFKYNEKNKILSEESLMEYTSRIGAVYDATETLTFLPMQLAQNMVDLIVWKAAYDQAIDRGDTERDAVGHADNTVERTQTSSAISSRASIRRGAQIYRLFTSLTSVPVTMNNLVRTTMQQQDTTFERATALVRVGMYSVILPGILTTLIGQALRGDLMPGDDDEEEDKGEWLEDMAMDVALETLQVAVPIFSAPASVFLRPEYGASLFPAQGLTRSLTTAAQAMRLPSDVELTPNEINAMLQSLSLLTGAPSAIIGRGVKFQDQLFTSEQERKKARRIRRRQLHKARRKEEREKRRKN